MLTCNFSGGDFAFFSENSSRPYSGTMSLSEMAERCPGLRYPGRVHSQALRKYVATTCQVICCTKFKKALKL